MHSITRGLTAGLLGAAALCLPAPAHAVAGTDADPPPAAHAAPPSGAYCGPDKATGLAVWADRTESCATALEVASAYTKAATRTAEASATVRVGGTTWMCQERQGDPNPYRECVATSDSGRRVVLSS
ncbi:MULTISPECIES: hypothetical protein [Streptomyces]|uniref:Secreted protein n=1 Tax=Streptomyces tricolor TaxID=68277 RepID=A0ABS9JT53_9ACTN|nr:MULTISPECIES: hypothetical protein [Streptomyces]MYU27033.1 hypothetical protein [Streptomyces sp. SID7810]CUW25870.1 hypothetical protein TUE45_00580 [Streptomyces reticuli]MCG0068737.1 hypothetical protein [Streptomyces tricolor]OYP13454.1 hypothetical protein CFC35_02225 [Streptomyces sp. FBKL.4005]BCM65193.1 hypothetical protein EASAB2608_00527 [Streptomyces sp. EAS-AB2608]